MKLNAGRPSACAGVLRVVRKSVFQPLCAIHVFVLLFVCVAASAQSRQELIEQQHALDAARHETNLERAAQLYQAYIDRYGGDAAWDEIAKRGLFAAMMRAQVKTGRWDSVERLGAAAVRTSPIADEIGVRRLYAQALDHLGKRIEAGEQRVLVQTLAFRELRAEEIRQPAPRLIALSIDGREVTLAKLRGKPVILAFWATWCAPCLEELRELNQVYPSIRESAELLAINTDDSAETAAEFARKNEYRFPVYKSDVSDWPASTIPQLFMVDSQGMIRFHFEGFEDEDHLFARKIGWMLEVAR